MGCYYTLIRLAKIKKADKYLLLTTIWNNQNSHTVLVEILTTLEKCIVVSFLVEHIFMTSIRNPTLIFSTRKIWKCLSIWRFLYLFIHTSIMSNNYKKKKKKGKLKQFKCFLTNERISKLWDYLAGEEKIFTRIWLNLNIGSIETTAWDYILCDPFIWSNRKKL